MTWRVSDGCIPETVERWLRFEGGITVSQTWDRYLCQLGVQNDLYRFQWPHDREPTLQEAIEAVARIGGR